ncbi:MAG: hypothetical protein F6K58_23755 [Symploca sp. SIO2E9]|nr:hypothetical protein [Symploca sp. SIO2E9]
MAEQISDGTLPDFEAKQKYQACIAQRKWGEIFRESFYFDNSSDPGESSDSEDNFKREWMHHVLEPVLGCLKINRHSLQIHPIEKELIYLSALSISQRCQLFISFPVSPVSLAILLLVYSAHLTREDRDIYRIHHAVAAKDFAIWVRPKNSGQILSLRTTKAFNLVDTVRCQLRERIACYPACKFNESLKSERLKVFTVRSLSEAIELLKQSSYCSLVLLDDPSGRTYPSPSNYGSEAFKLASLCKRRQIPMAGIVPPWTMKDIEYHEINNSSGILFWPIDFFALRSYSSEQSLFAHGQTHHPIEESYLLLERKQQVLNEAQVTIRTFDFAPGNEEIIAELFQETSDLLIELGKNNHLRNVWGTGWKIWRDISAPVLPFHLLWEQFIQKEFKRLEAAASRCGDDKALTLYNLLNSLASRLQKLKVNPFMEIIQAADRKTVVAVENAERADALEKFLKERDNPCSDVQILPLSELRGLGGERLIVLGQPKACYRDLLQTTFFREIDVMLWSVLAARAERWWSNLEVDARKWHQKTWRSLTGKEEVGRYGYSPETTSVQVVNTGTAKLSKSIDLSKLEERFSSLSGTSLDSGLTSSILSSLESHYLVEFEQGLRIKVAPGSEFLVLSRKKVHVVAIKELTAGKKVVLFEGMNRDELFAQKAGLLEDTKINYLYRVQLDAWRELVKEKVKKSDLQTVCKQIFRDTGLSIGEETIQYNWMGGNDLLSLPQEEEHFFWFIPPLARSGFKDFWQKVNQFRIKRRKLGQVITACAQEGWKERKSDEIVFQYQQVFITVGELRDAMQILKVQSYPQLIPHPPESPFNRIFPIKGVSNAA